MLDIASLALVMLLGTSLSVSQAQVTTATGCAVVQPDANDGVTVAPENHRVLFENGDVRVIDVTLAPHTKETMHTHARPSIFYLDGATAIRYTSLGDEAHAVTRRAPPAGMKPLVMAMEPESMHSVENLGDTAFHALRAELKHPGCDLAAQPALAPDASDAVVVAPAGYKVLFEDGDVRVIDVTIPPHTKEAMHTHPWGGVIYVVQAEPLRDWAADGSVGKVKEVPAGVKVLPANPAGLHATENVGDGTLHAVRFELKHATVKASGK